MAVREIVLFPDPILKTVCDPCDPGAPETKELVQDLLDTVAAVQRAWRS